MSTVTHFIDGKQAPKLIGTMPCVAENLLDFSAYNCGSSDVVQALKVPANTIVLNVWSIVKTAEGGTATATVGDGAGANSWDASTNLNAAAGTMTGGVPGTDAYATSGKFYATADTIDYVLGNACDTAKIVVKALMMSVENYA